MVFCGGVIAFTTLERSTGFKCAVPFQSFIPLRTTAVYTVFLLRAFFSALRCSVLDAAHSCRHDVCGSDVSMLHHNLLLSTAEDKVVCRFVVLWPDRLTGLRYRPVSSS